jgi:hypothetical protein
MDGFATRARRRDAGTRTLSQEIARRRHHGKEIVPNPKRGEEVEKEWWDCPICGRPQSASETPPPPVSIRGVDGGHTNRNQQAFSLVGSTKWSS